MWTYKTHSFVKYFQAPCPDKTYLRFFSWIITIFKCQSDLQNNNNIFFRRKSFHEPVHLLDRQNVFSKKKFQHQEIHSLKTRYLTVFRYLWKFSCSLLLLFSLLSNNSFSVLWAILNVLELENCNDLSDVGRLQMQKIQ